MNLYAADLCDKNPDRLGFFACLPSLLDTEAALAEITYALDNLKADGVVIFTRYGHGNTYLGHPDVEPIWRELHKRKAVVFVHSTYPADATMVNPKMPLPMVDYPHETTRAAMDMVVMGTRQKYPDCKVILSHAGGTLPYLISRLAIPMLKAPDFSTYHMAGTTRDKIMQDFKSFYYDIALSSSPQVLIMLFQMVPSDHILYGVS